MKVVLLAVTKIVWDEASKLFEEVGYPETRDSGYSDSEVLIEFAGRTCYRSFSRPNPATSDPSSYIDRLVRNGHLSVLEHAGFTIAALGVSRSLTHELVRHRHLSFSQLSQRYVLPSPKFVVPPLFEGNAEAIQVLENHYRSSLEAYYRLSEIAKSRAGSTKQVREAARSVLPNCTETDIIVSGNHRAWREFLQKRLCSEADREMQKFASEVHDIACRVAPSVYSDIYFRK